MAFGIGGADVSIWMRCERHASMDGGIKVSMQAICAQRAARARVKGFLLATAQSYWSASGFGGESYSSLCFPLKISAFGRLPLSTCAQRMGWNSTAERNLEIFFSFFLWPALPFRFTDHTSPRKTADVLDSSRNSEGWRNMTVQCLYQSENTCARTYILISGYK